MDITNDLHVIETRPLLSPAFIKSEFPLQPKTATLVAQPRHRGAGPPPGPGPAGPSRRVRRSGPAHRGGHLPGAGRAPDGGHPPRSHPQHLSRSRSKAVSGCRTLFNS